MADLTGRAVDAALAKQGYALLPISTDAGAAALTTSQRFPASGQFEPGDMLLVSSTGSFHVLAGNSSVAATTSSPIVPAGLYRMVLPDGCTHVAIIQASGATALGQVYKG